MSETIPALYKYFLVSLTTFSNVIHIYIYGIIILFTSGIYNT